MVAVGLGTQSTISPGRPQERNKAKQNARRTKNVNRLQTGERLQTDRSQPTLKELEKWSEREDLNLRPLVSQTSALTGLRHAPMPFH
jgi:hypothetical protein